MNTDGTTRFSLYPPLLAAQIHERVLVFELEYHIGTAKDSIKRLKMASARRLVETKDHLTPVQRQLILAELDEGLRKHDEKVESERREFEEDRKTWYGFLRDARDLAERWTRWISDREVVEGPGTGVLPDVGQRGGEE